MHGQYHLSHCSQSYTCRVKITDIMITRIGIASHGDFGHIILVKQGINQGILLQLERMRSALLTQYS